MRQATRVWNSPVVPPSDAIRKHFPIWILSREKSFSRLVCRNRVFLFWSFPISGLSGTPLFFTRFLPFVGDTLDLVPLKHRLLLLRDVFFAFSWVFGVKAEPFFLARTGFARPIFFDRCLTFLISPKNGRPLLFSPPPGPFRPDRLCFFFRGILTSFSQKELPFR